MNEEIFVKWAVFPSSEKMLEINLSVVRTENARREMLVRNVVGM